MPRIAFVSTMRGPVWGGSEDLWCQTAHYLLQNGIEVAVNIDFWREEAPQVQELERAGAKMTYRMIKRRTAAVLGQRYIDRMYNWVQNVKADLVVVSQGSHVDGLRWMKECRKRNQPYAVIAQAVRELNWPDEEDAKQCADAYEGAKRSYFVSQENLELARCLFVTPLPNASVVRNPFNVSYDKPLDWPAEELPIKMACVGRLYPEEKGQDLLFRALNSPKWQERPIEVNLFGSGLAEGSLKRLAQMYGLKNVHFRGQTKNIASVWQTHHALLLTSRSEGLPLAVVEAMLCGRPCIVTDVAGNIEVVEDGVTGYVAAGTKPNRIDEAMERAWVSRDTWRSMGQVAARRIRELVPESPAAVFGEELLQQLP